MCRVKKPFVVTGLDIGSSKIAATSASVGEDGSFEIIAHETQPSKGVARGLLVDLDEATGSVAKVFSKLRNKSPKGLGEIYANISGETIRGSRSVGMIPLALRGREVAKPDIDKCVNVASTIHLPFDREIIHKIVHKFSIDDQPWINNPLGLYASRLACEVYIITANVNQIENIYKCVNDAGYDVKEVVFSGIADGSTLLGSSQIEQGAILIDIGSSLTEISVFGGGSLSDLEIIPLGAQDIKGGLKDSPELNSIFTKANIRLQELSKLCVQVPSVTLTGGLVFNDGMIELAEEKFSCPVKMGVAKGIRGEITSVDSMRLATAIGLIGYACEKYRRKKTEEKNVVKRLSNKVAEIFNNYF